MAVRVNDVWPTGSTRCGFSTDTRTTVNNVWTVGDEVALWVQDESKGIYSYHVTDSQLGTMTGNYYWSNKDVPLTIQAVYPYRAVNESRTNLDNIPWSVQQEQDENDGYEKSDLLCSNQLSGVYYGNSVMLFFYHQTAKIVVNVKQDGLPESISDTTGDISLTIGEGDLLTMDGSFTLPTAAGSDNRWLGTWTLGSAKGSIKPHLATTPTTGNFATYEALVIPQDVVTGSKLLTFTAGKDGTSYGTFYYTLQKDANWKAGYVYTYNITIPNPTTQSSISPARMEVTAIEAQPQ